MKYQIILAVFLQLLFSNLSFAELWTKLTNEEHAQAIANNPGMEKKLRQYSIQHCFFRLNDYAEFKKNLLTAQEEPGVGIITDLPFPDGTVAKFNHYKRDILTAELQKEFDIHNTAGTAVYERANEPAMTQSSTYTEDEYSGMILGFVNKYGNKQVMIDSFAVKKFVGENLYVVYMLGNKDRWDSAQCE